MEGREAGGDRWEERGAGGKMNRRSLLERASSKTPYCRPPSSAGAAPHLGSRLEGIDERKGGWFSRAKHLLSPSSRVVPSFSPSFAASASAQPCSEDSARADSSRGPLREFLSLIPLCIHVTRLYPLPLASTLPLTFDSAFSPLIALPRHVELFFLLAHWIFRSVVVY